MEEKKYLQKLLEIGTHHNIDKKTRININETHVAFEGYPKKHPSDKNVLILLKSPFSENKKFYEFSIDTIGHVEDLGKVADENGESANKIRVWVEKGMPAILSESFIVK
jgi:hypothetical protein